MGMGGGATERGAGDVPLVGSSAAAAGAALYVLRATAAAGYCAGFLPPALLAGAGIRLSVPAFGSAAVAELPRPRFATGVTIASCFRQIGAVVGIAVLIAVLGSASARESLSQFHHSWAAVALTGIVSGVIAIGLGRVRAPQVNALPEPLHLRPAQHPRKAPS